MEGWGNCASDMYGISGGVGCKSTGQVPQQPPGMQRTPTGQGQEGCSRASHGKARAGPWRRSERGVEGGSGESGHGLVVGSMPGPDRDVPRVQGMSVALHSVWECGPAMPEVCPLTCELCHTQGVIMCTPTGFCPEVPLVCAHSGHQSCSPNSKGYLLRTP